MIKSINIFAILILMAFTTNAQVLLSSKKFDAEGIKKLEVEGSFVKVNLSGINGDRIAVDGRIEGPRKYEGKIEIKTDLDGTTLKVWIERPNSVYGNIKGEINIDVPKGTIVEAKNSSGSMYAKNLEASDLDLSCSSGRLEVENLKGNLRLKASSGSINAKDLVGNTVAKTSSGSLKIYNLNGNLEAGTSSGRMTLGGTIEGDVTGKTSSGGISLDNVSGALNLQSSSGSIKGENVKITGDSSFKASSGSISIYLDNDVDDLSFNLRANSGSLRVGDRRGEDQLVIKRGGANITARTSSGSISFK